MLERLRATAAIFDHVMGDVGGFLHSGPRVQARFLRSLAGNIIDRTVFWPRGIIPRNYTEHGLSEHFIEEALIKVSLPITLVAMPIWLPFAALSYFLPEETDQR